MLFNVKTGIILTFSSLLPKNLIEYGNNNNNNNNFNDNDSNDYYND